MKVLVDADACPNMIKEILFRASKRVSLEMIFFANHALMLPKTPYIKFRQVSKGFDVADGEIIKIVERGDLVITADIPLADSVIDKHATAINPRGMTYTKENIKQKLGMRNFMEELRGMGKITGGPAALSKSDLQEFANALDKYLAANLK